MMTSKGMTERTRRCRSRRRGDVRFLLSFAVAVVALPAVVFGFASPRAAAYYDYSVARHCLSRQQTTLHLSSEYNDDEPNSSASVSPDPIASTTLLNDLIPKSEITALIQQKSDVQGAMQVSFHFILYVLAAMIPNTPLSTLLMAFIGSFFFCGLHECVHRSAFRTKWLNGVFAHVFGFLTLRPALHYTYYHWQHHRYTGDSENDSELQQNSFLDFNINSVGSYLLYLSGVPFWVDAVTSLLKHASGKCSEMYLTSAKAKSQVCREARIYLVLYLGAVLLATMTKRSTLLFQYWILPALLGQPFLRFYLLGEHRGRKTTPHNILENTRTITQTPFVYRRLAWNMPYHAEHHAWPSIPFYKLRQVHEVLYKKGGDELFDQGELYPELKVCNGRTGYLSLNWRFLRRLRRTKQQPKKDEQEVQVE